MIDFPFRFFLLFLVGKIMVSCAKSFSPEFVYENGGLHAIGMRSHARHNMSQARSVRPQFPKCERGFVESFRFSPDALGNRDSVMGNSGIGVSDNLSVHRLIFRLIGFCETFLVFVRMYWGMGILLSVILLKLTGFLNFF